MSIIDDIAAYKDRGTGSKQETVQLIYEDKNIQLFADVSIMANGGSLLELTSSGLDNQMFFTTRELGELIEALQAVHADMGAEI